MLQSDQTTPLTSARDVALERRLGALQAVLDSTPDGLAVVDADGELASFNEKLLRLWGLEEPGPAAALFGAMASRLRDPRHPLFRPGAPLAEEVNELVELADGRVFEVWVRPRPGGGRIWWFRDVSPWRHAEADLTERNHRIALGNDVGAAVVAGGGLRQVLQGCAEAILRNLEGSFARVWLLDETEGVLTLEASAGLHTGLTGRFSRIPVGHAKIGGIARSRVPHLTNDLLNDPLLADPDWARRAGMVAFAGYPLVFEDRLVGVVAMFAQHPLSATVLESLKGCADRLAMAVARAWSEAEVRESEQRFRLLAEAAVEGIVIHDRGVLVDANPGFSALLGYSADELPGRRITDFLQLPDDAPVFEQPRELLGIHRDGGLVPLEVAARCISRGGKELWVLVMRDLSDRKHLEEQTVQLASERAAHTRAGFLARASHVLGSSLDSRTTCAATARLAVPTLSDFSVVFTLEEGRVAAAAAAHADVERETVLREVAGTFVGSDPAGVPAGDGDDGERAELLAELRRRLPPDLEPRALACLPLNASGTTVGLLALAVTETGRELDAPALALAEELAYRAGSALENARLFDAAVHATQARDDLLGIVAHDLRNPLNLIGSAAELILEGVFDGNAAGEQRHLQIIRRAAGQMNRLIADLLDARRIETGGLDIDPRAEDVAFLLSEALSFMGPLAESNGLRLSTAAPDGLPAVRVDPGRIQQVFSNLVGNAIKFTPRGGTIHLTAEPDGDQVRLGVTDSGPGIAAAQLPHVFNRFWQADSRDRRGIGLGLTIARAIVEGHAGRIWVESEPGRGTTFYFTLPVARE
ncbi:MAG TPA: ATP-binding protein [Longimicrobium sp.]|jgi:PAS domain S-box-containing protein